MPFAIPSLNSLRSQIRADLGARIGGTAPALRRMVTRVLGDTFGGALFLQYRFLVNLSQQLFLDTATAEYLERNAGIYKITRKGAAAAAGNVTFSGTSGLTVPAGLLLQNGDGSAQYATQSSGVLVSGAVTLPVIATTPGTVGNAVVGDALTILVAVAGVLPTAAVAAGDLTGGLDQESDDLLRGRALLRIRQPPQGGDANDYVEWAEEVPGVTRAWALPRNRGAGTCDVTFAMDGRSNIIPLPGDVATVQAAIDAKRPVTADVTVFAPTARPIPVTLTNLSPTDPTTRAEIRASLAAFFRTTAPNSIVYLEAVSNAINVAGGITAFDLLAPAADVPASPGQIATLGTVTFADPIAIGSGSSGGAVTTSSYSGTLAITAAPASYQVLQRDTRTGSTFGKGAGAVALTINPTASGTTLEWRLRDADATSTTLVDWTQCATSFTSGSQALSLSLPATAKWLILDIRPNGDDTKIVSTSSRFAVGEVVAISGQSLAVDAINPHNNDTSTSLASLGLTPGAYGVMFASTATSGGVVSNGSPSWAQPSNGAFYSSAFAAEFLNRAVAGSGVCVGLIGHAVGGGAIAAFAAGQAARTQLDSVLAGAGGKFGTFLWEHGHADSLAGTTQSAYQTALSTLLSTLASAYPGFAFKSLLSPIPSIIATSQGTAAQIQAIRAAHLAYRAANASTAAVVMPFDAALYSDGLHLTQAGQQIAARHFARAFLGQIGTTTHSDTGPAITGAIRTSGSALIRLTVAQSSGSALTSSGTLTGLFTVFNAGTTTSPLTINSVTLASPTEIDLALSAAPANTQALDIYYRMPFDTTATNSAIIADNDTADGISSTGRLLAFTTTSAITAAAPGSTAWVPSNLGAALVYAADTGNTTTSPDDGAGHAASVQHLYDATKAMVQTTSGARPAYSTTAGATSGKRVLTYTTAQWLQAGGSGGFAALANLFNGAENTTNGTWIVAAKIDTTAGFSFVSVWANADSSQYFQLRQHNATNLVWQNNDADGTGASASAAEVNGWHYFTCIKSGGTLTLRVDGVQVGTDTVGGTVSFTASDFALGALSSGGVWTTGSPPQATAGMIACNTALTGADLANAEAWVKATAGL